MTGKVICYSLGRVCSRQGTVATPSLPSTQAEQRCAREDTDLQGGAPGGSGVHPSQTPHSAPSKVWGSLSAAAGGSGRLVWVIFCLGFFVSSSSSVSLSQT